MSDETAEPELPRAVALAWGVAANPQRGPKRELSIERIVEVAMQLADAGGLASVSMAAVASELGFTPMSLYRYVSAKDDLVLLMQETGVGVPPENVLEADGWRAGMAAWAEAFVQATVEHPWLLDIAITSIPTTPNNLAWFDAALEVLAATPLSYDDKTAIVLAVEAQSRWEATVRRGYSEAGDSEAEVRDAKLLASLVTAEEFPQVFEAMREGAFAPGAGGDPFVFGLERVLDGIDAYLAGRSPAAPAFEVDPLDREAARDQRYKEAVKARREAEKKVREARKKERELLRAARDRLRR
ncbi:MAG TPA: TetR/AcrR family transcriptional regulator [Pseudolysinimonas sp.]|jgi:AcrR family transcriptional regulator